MRVNYLTVGYITDYNTSAMYWKEGCWVIEQEGEEGRS